jgi:hypothetical protein
MIKKVVGKGRKGPKPNSRSIEIGRLEGTKRPVTCPTREKA